MTTPAPRVQHACPGRELTCSMCHEPVDAAHNHGDDKMPICETCMIETIAYNQTGEFVWEES